LNLGRSCCAMKRKYFGTDGIRGTVGQSPITPDFMLRLAHSVGQVLKRSDPRPKVLIGKDTRISGYMLESALEAGFNSAGVDVVLLGPIPTPGVAYLTRALRASLGVVISASHNPFNDNGVKFFSASGAKLDDAWEIAVEEALSEEPYWVPSHLLGKTKRLDDATGRYIEFCKSTFDANLTLKGKKIVVDAAHGAAYVCAPQIFAELGAEVVSIGCSPNGININEDVGATHPEALVQAVIAHQADVGIALDGDADRLQWVDDKGLLFNGDQLLYVLARDRLANGEKIPGVVGTLMTNKAISEGLSRWGVELTRAKVGDRYVLESLLSNGWLLGGESSGHLLVLDKHSTGDGLISALQVLQACLRMGTSIQKILEDVPLFPQCLLNIAIQPDLDWRHHTEFQKRIASVETKLGSSGRVLIRESGTEPLLRIMVEASQEELSSEMAAYLADSLS
jgi:phosphoglucosamine mutase